MDTTTRETLAHALVGGSAESQRAKPFTIDKTDWIRLRGGRLAVGDPQRTGGNLCQALQKKLGMAEALEPNWRRARMCAARWRWSGNEAPLGIVYGSDAVASKGVNVVATFPEKIHIKSGITPSLSWRA